MTTCSAATVSSSAIKLTISASAAISSGFPRSGPELDAGARLEGAASPAISASVASSSSCTLTRTGPAPDAGARLEGAAKKQDDLPASIDVGGSWSPIGPPISMSLPDLRSVFRDPYSQAISTSLPAERSWSTSMSLSAVLWTTPSVSHLSLSALDGGPGGSEGRRRPRFVEEDIEPSVFLCTFCACCRCICRSTCARSSEMRRLARSCKRRRCRRHMAAKQHASSTKTGSSTQWGWTRELAAMGEDGGGAVAVPTQCPSSQCARGGGVGAGACGGCGAVVRRTGSHCGGQATPRAYVGALGRRWPTAAATPIKTRLLTLFDCFACGRCTDTHGYEGMKVSEKDGSVSIRRTNT